MAGTEPAHAARTPSPTPTSKQSPSATPANAPDRVRITLTSLEPKALAPHDVVDITGTAVNTSGQPLTNVSVALRGSSHRIDTRFDLAREADPTDILGTTLLNTRQTIGELDPGAEFDWHFSLPEERARPAVGPDDFGAYPLAVDVRSTVTTSTATTSTVTTSTATTRLPTTVLWLPTGARFVPTQISWLLPLIDGIHRGVGTTFTDDTLASDLAESGRLSRLLALANTAKVPLTYLIDPALVDDATVMAGSGNRGRTQCAAEQRAGQRRSRARLENPVPAAKVASRSRARPAPLRRQQPRAGPIRSPAGSGAVAGAGTAVASDWLANLRAAIRADGSAVVGLPYGDTDLVALERAGLTKESRSPGSTGQSTLERDLRSTALPNVAWPVDGTLDEPTLDELASDLIDTVVLSDTALPPRDANAVTGARTNLQTASGTVRAVLTDST